jgi:hypothetical protein
MPRYAASGETTMNERKGVFETLREIGKTEGMTSTGLSAPGDMAAFIVILSMARALEDPKEPGVDPRLR